MSTITGPYTVTPGGTVQIPQPQAGGQLSQLILDNLSTYILQVSIGASIFYQAPLVEQSYDIRTTSQPVIVTAIAQPGDNTTSGQLTPTWYAVGEEQKGQWPIALSGPAEVAAATAAAIFNLGVPNVLLEDLLFAGSVAAGASQSVDVSKYSSAVVRGVQLTGTSQLSLKQYDANGRLLVNDYMPPLDLRGEAARISLNGASLLITNETANPEAAVVAVIGSNRTPPSRYDARSQPQLISTWTIGTTAMAAGSNYQLANTDTDVQPSGLCSIRCLVSNSAVKGYFVYSDAAGTGIVFADTAEFIAGASGPSVMKQFHFPPGLNNILFHCTAAGSSSAVVQIVGDSS